MTVLLSVMDRHVAVPVNPATTPAEMREELRACGVVAWCTRGSEAAPEMQKLCEALGIVPLAITPDAKTGGAFSLVGDPYRTDGVAGGPFDRAGDPPESPATAKSAGAAEELEERSKHSKRDPARLSNRAGAAHLRVHGQEEDRPDQPAPARPGRVRDRGELRSARLGRVSELHAPVSRRRDLSQPRWPRSSRAGPRRRCPSSTWAISGPSRWRSRVRGTTAPPRCTCWS